MEGELAMPGQDVERTGQSSPLKFMFEVINTIVIFLIVWGRFLPVIVITSCCGLAELSMSMHGLCTHCEIVKAAGTNEAQMVVYSLQMVYHHPFIFAFFPTPQA